MSGWKIVPVELTPEMFEADVRCACDAQAERMLGSGATFADAMHACYRAQLAAAPEPDWEALATKILNTNAYDKFPTGGEIFRLSAALKAAFGSKP